MVKTIGIVKIIRHDGIFAWVQHPESQDEIIKRKMQSDNKGEYVRIEGYNYRLD
jgi:hypothetical protein